MSTEKRDRFDLSSRRQALVDALLEREGVGSRREEKLVRRARPEGTAPLSFAQQRLWFLHQMEPESPAYNVFWALRLSGELDVDALKGALRGLAERHEVLRTSFPAVEGGAVQAVSNTPEVPLRFQDVGDMAVEEREAEMETLARSEVEAPFDLARGPLIRALLMRRERTEHVLILTLHHIVSDGWSRGVISRDLMALYEAGVTGEKPKALADLAVQYADYAEWQRERLSGVVLSSQLSYWKKRLEDVVPLELPADRPRRTTASCRGAVKRFVLPSETTGKLRAFGRESGATPFMILLAGFQALLHRYTGQTDITVGSPIANRNRTELEDLIGFFVNTLVMRGDLSGNPTFRELVLRTREVAIDAFSHQDLPFDTLVEEINPERRLSRNPLFQVMFAVQNVPVRSLSLRGLEVSPYDLAIITTRFDLEVYFAGEESLLMAFVYSVDLFDAETIDRMFEHFRVLLEGALDQGDRPIASLPLLTGTENRVLLEANDTRRELPEAPVHLLVEKRAEERPEAPAVVFGDERVSYAELNRRANRLAHYLRKRGVAAEIPVGICVERSIEAVVGLLAILKSGGFYVPLDPAYPEERLKWMLADASAKLVLTDEGRRSSFSGGAVEVVVLGGESAFQEEPSQNLPAVTTPDSLAYAIYTSGSTGLPKGVGVPHRAVNRLVRNTNYVELTAEDRVAQASNLSFDAATFEIWGALTSGASLVVVPREVALSTQQYADAIERHGISAMFLTTALFNQVAREKVEAFGSVTHVLFGGEAVDPVSVRRVLTEGRPKRLLHVYGPTETTTFAAWQLVESVPEGAPTVPIGGALANTELHVLDSDMTPVPLGVPGELYIGGAGLARGYLHRPELTAEKFVPSPFGEPGSRLYRTGDRTRRRSGGALEFLGRVDHQVKIRGFRVEPGEIESAVLGFAGVRDAVVVAREESQGTRRLVAYLVPESDTGSGHGADSTSERVSRWRKTYDEVIYGEVGSERSESPTFNIAGWDSTYTGTPLPAEAMREQVDQTVARIRSLAPERILEIGCGTGLLLFELAPHCEKYVATDFSPVALDYVRRNLEALGEKRASVTLLERRAEDFDGIEARGFDVVILNSTVQYFPGVSYLLDVLEGAAGAIRDGGHLFVGDVRHHGLLEAFHTEVQLHQMGQSPAAAKLKNRVRQEMSREQELLVAPELFRALRKRVPRAAAVWVSPKRGRHENELTQFRYDAMVRIGGGRPDVVSAHWEDWGESGMTVSGLGEWLSKGGSGRPRAFSRVPNSRVERSVSVSTSTESRPGVDPEDLWRLEEKFPCRVELSWLAGREDGSFDVAIAPKSAGPLWFPEPFELEDKPWPEYGNDPLAGSRTRGLVPRLREHLGEKLPEYMVPSAFVVLADLPLNANGKVDRAKLPSPESARPELANDYVAPRGPVEEGVAGIWGEVLGVARIGAHDDFFDLGGHSLLATQVMSRVRQAFQVEVPLRSLFELPTVSGLSGRVEELRRRGASIEAPPIARRERPRALPLSFAQQRLWFLDRLRPGNSAYSSFRALRLRGELDEGAMKRAFAEILRRHEILRTVYEIVGGEPAQIVLPPENAVETLDLRGMDPEKRDAEMLKAARAESKKPLDLALGPVIRVTLVKLAEQDHALFLAMHHIVYDAWSLNVLARELALLYESFRDRWSSPLPELPIQYAEFALWQREWLQGEPLQNLLSLWRERLSGDLESLSLPLDRPRPALQSFEASSCSMALPVELSRELERLSARRGVTLFMTLLAAFDALLHRYTGQEDIVVGTPIAGRNRAEIEGLIGFFVNSLVLRTKLTGEMTFDALLDRVRDVALSAYAGQDLPFEKLVEEMAPKRDLGQNPLFQVMFALQNAPAAKIELPGLEAAAIDLGSATTRLDLEVHVVSIEGTLQVRAVYAADLFDDGTIERLLLHYRALLEGVCAAPGTPLRAIPLLSASERERILSSWNRTEKPLPMVFLTSLFEEQARKRPDAIAVVFEGDAVTYSELNRRANRLARRLRGLGVGPEVPVGIRLYRSLEMVVAILAVLKAGGAYVPLDPEYPQERLDAMLEDAKAALVLTSSQDAESRSESPENLEPLAPIEMVDSAAYIIFTSGSTGRPKGAANGHRALTNRILWMQEQYRLTPEDRVLQKTPFSFDVSVWEFLWPLSAGARLVMAKPGGHRDPDYLVRTILEEKVTTLHFVPSMLRSFLGARRVEECRTIRRVIASGEELSKDLATLFHARLEAELHNLYGPTEAAIDVTFWAVEKDDARSYVPIGYAVANTRMYVLDEELEPVPIGVAGDLYVGGVQVGRGYQNRPDLTADRFVPDPFSEYPGARLYRTGDLARYREDGALQYLGRADFQVKLRGFRIELQEIESALDAHPSVAKSSVLLREAQRSEDRTLVAYVEARGEEPAPRELQAFLKSKLPEYMVPSAFVFLDTLPLSPSGKLDRKALPSWNAPSEEGPGEGDEGPRNPVEEALAAVWREVLARSDFGIHADFFDLGGHSLSATQVASRVSEMFQVDIPLQTFFERPTIAAFAVAVERAVMAQIEALPQAELEGLEVENG